jgi:hypothetical protein
MVDPDAKNSNRAALSVKVASLDIRRDATMPAGRKGNAASALMAPEGNAGGHQYQDDECERRDDDSQA